MQLVTTFVEYSVPRTGDGQYGPWSLHVFKDSSGQKFQTFKDDLALLGRGLLNQPVTVTFDQEVYTYTKQDGTPGQGTNNKISSIEAASAGAAAPPLAQGQVTGGFPVTQPTPQPAPAAQPAEDRGAIIGGQWAINAAIEAHKAGIAVVSDPAQLQAVATLFKTMAAAVAAA